MRLSGICLLLAIMVWAKPVLAETTTNTEELRVVAARAYTWSDRAGGVVQATGGVTLQLDRAKLSADSVVVWIDKSPATALAERRVEIVLIGHAKLEQSDVTRSGESLLVTALVRGEIVVAAENRTNQSQEESALYRSALALKPTDGLEATATPRAAKPGARWQAPRSIARPLPAAATQPAPLIYWLEVQFGQGEMARTSDGHTAAVLSGGIVIVYRDQKSNYIEFSAQRAVCFSNVSDPTTQTGSDKSGNLSNLLKKVDAVYLEGDVRVNQVPADATRGEQRMTAERVYYEFGTDRAILTEAVLHTVDLKKQIPIFVRAQVLRQLSQGEFRASYSQLATSGMLNPSYALAAEKIYVRQHEFQAGRAGRQTDYAATNVTMSAWGVPFFFLPWAGGSMDGGGNALRDISVGTRTHFGFGTEATLGLFELAGKPRPTDVDARLDLGYFDQRGPAMGLNGEYAGGFVSETTHKPWNFQGDFQSYLVTDRGADNFGGARAEVEPPKDIRGTFLWEHQHFFPDDWQAQLRLGYVSDAGFLEQWFPKQFDDGLPRDMSIYLKRQRNTEAFTFFANVQPRNTTTSAEFAQEQFEVERVPEIGYYRLGDSLLGDSLTAFSSNTIGGYRFAQSGYSLAEQGFSSPAVQPGLPSVGRSGLTGDVIYRGDFREELDFPFSTPHFRWVPYVFGRYTAWSDSPGKGSQNRVYGGTGLRVTTQFWGVDDSVQSDVLDIHRLRHVIEPELNLYTSAQSRDQQLVYDFEEQTDEVNDVSAVQIALHQRWQTKRGGPGRWRSVDVFALNLEGNFFANKPDDPVLNPSNFRGLFFSSLPEASVPRNSVNADATWRVTDTTVVLADAQMNLDKSELATASIGLAAQRLDRTTFYVGTRYIEELKTNITTLALDYQINEKYLLSMAQSFDFGRSENVSYNFGITRKFDRFFFQLQFVYDQTTNDTGFSINLLPYGVSRGLGVTSAQLENR